MHVQRHHRPGHRRACRAHAGAADSVWRRKRDTGRGAAHRAVPPRVADPCAAQPLFHRARRGVAAAGRGLSVHEADHLVAAGVVGIDVQLGGTARLFGGNGTPGSACVPSLCGLPVLDARLRHNLCAAGQGRRHADRRQVDRAAVRRRVGQVGGGVLCHPVRAVSRFWRGGRARLAVCAADAAGGRASRLAGGEPGRRRSGAVPQIVPRGSRRRRAAGGRASCWRAIISSDLVLGGLPWISRPFRIPSSHSCSTRYG